MSRNILSATRSALFALVVVGGASAAFSADLVYDRSALPNATPWLSEEINTASGNFQFVIIGDRTGGANVEGTFKLALDQIKLLQPQFVVNVGDMIEGYSDKKDELIEEWDEIDQKIKATKIPFFRTPGNHDIANETAQQVWRDRYGATYYHFVYKDTLFLILDTEDPPPRGSARHKREARNIQTTANGSPRQSQGNAGRVHVR